MAIISSGTFVSTGLNTTLSIRSDLDYMNVYNYTKTATPDGSGAEFYWQRGMDAGTGLEWTVAVGGAVSAAALTTGGFTLYDGSLLIAGNPVSLTAITNVVQPVITVASTAGLLTGDIVLLSNVAAQPTTMGIPVEIEVINGTTFRFRYALANAPGAVGGAGFYRLLPPSSLYQPERRTVINIASSGATTVVTTSVSHGYTVGEKVRMYVPSAANGMVEINNLQGSVTAINTTLNTFTLDIDSSAFTPFVFPAAADSPYTPAQCMAFGSVAADNLTLLDDATRNDAIIGITLAGGADSPAGQASDVIYWVAGKSDQNNVTP